ncbi:hypothetical protein [Candidatus Hodarchaeum mangrovi]
MLRQKNLIIVLSIFLLLITPVPSHSAQPVLIECYIIYYSECSACMSKYSTYVKPFYNSYRDNETIDFLLIDTYTEIGLASYWDIIDSLDINTSTLQGFPWVIFHWGDNQLIIIDERNLESIETTFLAILTDSGYTVPKTSQPFIPIISIESLDLPLLGISSLLILGGLIFLNIPCLWYFSPNRNQKVLKRISKKRFLILIGLTLISLITLTYQLLDYIRGGCGCAGGNLAQVLLFRRYDHLMLFNIEIPFSLMGIGLMSSIFIIINFISIIPTPFSINIETRKFIVITEKNLQLLYKLLTLLLFVGFLSLFYLLYIELFLLEFICLLCTISQMVIIIDILLVFTWKPFHTNQVPSPLINKS